MTEPRDLDRLEALLSDAHDIAPGTRWMTISADTVELFDALPALVAEVRRLRNELNDATGRIETLMHQLNDAQDAAMRLELRQEDHDRRLRVLVQLWNTMVNTEQGWRILVEYDLLREFEQVVLNE